MADDGGGEAINRPMKVSKGSRELSRLKNLDKKPHILSVGGRLTSRSSSDKEETAPSSTGRSLLQRYGCDQSICKRSSSKLELFRLTWQAR
ncbi:hypothetical protein PVK06_002503 [Gossypium arboreum]|uniref:Uncharacterized protein n=1 Tax=Gossypium arboreum TaxID=29729 RepID=A0ABR0R4W0_GOSAR|nr:hypothetical protein PVK06_002503 [Gossypium arboreum]